MALIDKINDGFITITNLLKGKVNKTDVIAVEQGGTGATNVATARSNLGLGTAATANLTTSSSDTNIGNVVKNGDYGIGYFREFELSLDWNNKTTTSKYAKLTNSYATYFVGMGNVAAVSYGNAIVRVLKNASSGYGYDILWGIAFGFFGDKEIYRINSTQDATTKLWAETVYTLLDTGNSQKYDITFKSLKSGTASYKKGWRKLTTTLPSTAGEITVAHGVTTVETVQAKVTNSDGIIIYNNDIDPANQFYVRVNGANLVLGVTANSTKVFGKAVTIYVGEEL